MSSDPQDSDRRDFFRINDRIGLEYRLRPSTEPADTDPFGNNHLDGLKTELRRLDLDIRSQLVALSDRDRLLASIVKSLNGKVDTLARIMAFEQNPLQPQQWREVTLSEGGISFPAPAGQLKPGDKLALRLTLPPELFQPQAIARVLDITPLPGDQGEGMEQIHTDFINIQDTERQQIAKHVMGWQIRQRQGGEASQ